MNEYHIGDRIKIDACTDARLAAKTNGQKGTVIHRYPEKENHEYVVKLDGNPFALSYHAMDLMPA